MKRFDGQWMVALFLGVAPLSACGGSESPGPEAMPAPSDNSNAGSMAMPSNNDTPKNNENNNSGGTAAPSSGGTGAAPKAGAGAPAMTAGTNASNMAGAGGSPAVAEELDKDVDWTAYKLIYPELYSAYDGVHTFQVPVHVDGVMLELSDWQAIPSSAVTIEADPENKGVMITIVAPVEEITIAAHSGPVGGTAKLHVTIATPEDWMVGDARYHNGIDYMLPELDFTDIIDPNWMPPLPPENLACNNCHTTGAKYFEIQHTPTQIGGYSDQDLITIFTTGVKPANARFVFLPEQFQDLYPEMHRWMASEQEQKGLIVYLRSLTPAGQGDFLIPEVTGVPGGMMP